MLLLRRLIRAFLVLWRGKTEDGRPTAFSLRRMLLILAPIVLVYLVFWPKGHVDREDARHVVCISNLHQISLLLAMYHDDYAVLPRSLGSLPRKYVPDAAILRCPASQKNYIYNPRYSLEDEGRPWVVRCATPSHSGMGVRVTEGQFAVTWPPYSDE